MSTESIPFQKWDYPFAIEFTKPAEASIRIDTGPGASFTRDGLLKSVSIDSSSENVPVHVSFMYYGARAGKERSGAYLFLPNGAAQPMRLPHDPPPTVIVMRGPLESSVTAGLTFAVHENVLRAGAALEIRNLIDIGNRDNEEIIMRMSTGIKSEQFFYTDMNGLSVSILMNEFWGETKGDGEGEFLFRIKNPAPFCLRHKI